MEKVQSNLETASTITEEVVVEVRPLTQEEMEVRDRQLVLAAVDALGF